jgi:hypothetical protein
MQSTYWLENVLKMISLYLNALFGELTTLSCIACTAICCSVHKSELTYKEIIFSTFSNQSVLCICTCLISCTESETYAHLGLRDGGPVFHAPPCTFLLVFPRLVESCYSFNEEFLVRCSSKI